MIGDIRGTALGVPAPPYICKTASAREIAELTSFLPVTLNGLSASLRTDAQNLCDEGAQTLADVQNQHPRCSYRTDVVTDTYLRGYLRVCSPMAWSNVNHWARLGLTTRS